MPSTKYGPRSKAERKQRSNNVKSAASGDSNTVELVSSETQNERQQRKQALRDALVAEQSGQMSSKKKKRLDKYIENKLKKEEAQVLLTKLNEIQANANISSLRSSRDLKRKFTDVSTKSEREQMLGPPIRPAVIQSDASHSDSSDDQGLSGRNSSQPTRSTISSERVPEPPKPTSAVTVGSGLKRPLKMGLFGGPIIRKRQRTKAPEPQRAQSPAESEVSWEGFSSDGSGEDASSNASDPDESEDTADTDDEDGSEGSTDDDLDSDDEDAVNNLAESMLAALAKKRAERDSGAQEPKRDLSGFRVWAAEQLNEARDFAPSRALEEAQAIADLSKTVSFQPRPSEQDALPTELQAPKVNSTRQAYSVRVERSEALQDARSKLPVVAEEQKIMEAIHNNPITIVCGATGSGKTTQVPQFLFEAGYGDKDGPTPGMIAVTQPRRVAAVTMANRVSQELGSAGSKVAYQIRYGSTVDRGTAMKFMTDGILIREIATDFVLSKYSAIVIDEAHERSVNTDILIGMLSRIVDLREQKHKHDPQVKPLKLIIMSATLMVKAFTENPNLFKQGAPPLVESEGRQYPVVMHFARRTERDYLDAAFQKILRGHKKLPHGAILVFLTGENEILALSKKLQEALGQGASRHQTKVRIAATEAPLEDEDFDSQQKHNFVPDEEDSMEDGEHDEDEFDVEPDEDAKDKQIDDVLILPLYSKLPTKDQLRVFDPVPEGTRLIVLSTNVAETSVTIPGVRYVFDCGRSKEKRYDQTTGVQSFEIDWISKASAAQRAGRAGRTGPGHCYRLYSSAVYERDFADHTKPEILRMPVEGVVLQLKSMDLQHVVKFPFPTPPDQEAIVKAEKLLSYLGAVDTSGKVTPIGRDLSIYPLSPRYAKMLAVGHQQECMLLTIAMVAALATPELFVPENLRNALRSEDNNDPLDKTDEAMVEKQELSAYRRAQRTFSALDRQADALKLLSAFAAYQFFRDADEAEDFCRQTFLRSKALKEASQLFQQLLRIVADNRPGLVNPEATELPRANEKQVKALKQIVAVGFIDQVAIRADLAPVPPDLSKPKRATDVAYLTLFPSHENRMGSPEEKAVYIHASSVLADLKVSDMPQYLIYSHLHRASASTIDGGKIPKVRMHPLTSVTAAQLTMLTKGTPLLEYGKPIGKIEPVPGNVDKRVCWVVPSLVGQKGVSGWPLPARKVIQKRGPRGTWEVEKLAT